MHFDPQSEGLQNLCCLSLCESVGALDIVGADPAEKIALLISLRRNGEDVLRPLPEKNNDPFLVGSPLLLPANRTAGGRFSFGGKSYQLPVNEARSGANLHGQLYNAPFSVCSADREAVVLSYENRGERYPFPYQVTIYYRLLEEGLCAFYRIKNTGETAMPFTFGLHTTFAEPEQFQVPLLDCQERDCSNIPTGRYIPLKEREKMYIFGSPSQDMAISGYYRAAGDIARVGNYTYAVTGFDHWVLYNGGGHAGFLCVEPQRGGVNGLNSGIHCPQIPVGGSAEFQTEIHRS